MATLDTLQNAAVALTEATTSLLAAVNVTRTYLDTQVSAAAASATLATTNGAIQVALAALQPPIATSNGAAQVTLAAAQAALATSQGAAQVALATTQANLATTDGAAQVTLAINQANLATSNGAAQVALANTQANLATANGAAQVTLATTQAGLATTDGAAQVALAAAQATAATTDGAAQVTLATNQAALATSNGAAQVALATTQANLATSNGAAQVALAAAQATAATTDGAAQVTLAAAQATLATSNGATQVGLATTQAGLATSQGAAQVTLANTQANLATSNGAAQVALATTQAGLATTDGAAQVTLATTQATNSGTSLTNTTTQATNSGTSLTTATNQVALSTTQAGLAAASATSTGASLTTATTQAGNSATSATNSTTSAGTSTTQAGIATTQAGLTATALTNTTIQATAAAASLTAATASVTTATAQATATGASATAITASASGAATSASTAAGVVTQDLSALTNVALHRSPNVIVSMFIYDTTKDSDGGAWTERQQDKSWFQEALNGTWVSTTSPDGWSSELDARGSGATVGAEVSVDPNFSTSTGWTLTSATIASGVLTITNASGGVTVASRIDAVTLGQPYQVTVTVSSLTLGAITVRLGNTAALRTLSQAGTYVFTVLASVAASSISLGTSGVTTGTVTRFSIKPITALGIINSSYYQLNTDGKFYRLYTNLFRNSGFLGTSGGPGTYPTGWFQMGTQSNTVSLTSEVVNGVTTGVVKIRMIVGPVEGITQNLSMPMWAGSFNVRVLVRIPTGITAGALITADVAGTQVTIATAATLNAQTKDVWVAYTSTHTTTGVRASVGIGFTTGTAGNGADLAFPSIEFGTSSYAVTPVPVSYEVFRGNKAKFPKVSAIVAESLYIVIYDLTETGRPMWKKFTQVGGLGVFYGFSIRPFTSVFMLNGILAVGINDNVNGGTCGLAIINFPTDRLQKYTSIGTSSNNNASMEFPQNIAAYQLTDTFKPSKFLLQALASGYVNDVQMILLADSVFDAATGLQIPTIVCSTPGGVSVLRSDGVIVNSANGGTYTRAVVDQNEIVGINFQVAIQCFALSSSIAASFAIANGHNTVSSVNVISTLGTTVIAGNKYYRRYGSSAGITLIKENPGTPNNGLQARITSVYNSGWYPGTTYRVYLANSETETLIAASVITGNSSNFSTGLGNWRRPTGGESRQGTVAAVGGKLSATSPPSVTISSMTWSANVVTVVTATPHGYQSGETTFVSGVTPSGYNGYGGNVTVVNSTTLAYSLNTNPGTVTVQGILNSASAAELPISTVIGQTYRLTFTADFAWYFSMSSIANTGSSGNIVAQTFIAVGLNSINFVATTTTTYLVVYTANASSITYTWSNFTAVLVVPDRSYRAQGATVNGSLTKALTGIGNQVVAFSGWSNLNYIREIYSTDLELGLSDVSIAATVNYLYGGVNANFLTFPEQFDNTAWAKLGGSSVTANTQTAPDSTLTADTLTAGTSSYGGVSRNAYTFLANTTYTSSVYAKAGTAQRVGIRPSGGAASLSDQFCWIDLSTGVVTVITPASGTIVSATSVNAGNGWWRLIVTYTTGSTAPSSIVDVAIVNSGGGTNYAPAGTETAHLWGAKLNQGLSAGTYTPSQTAVYNPIHPIVERSYSYGAYFNLGIDGNGYIVANVYDGFTLRTVSTPTSYGSYGLGIQVLVRTTYVAGRLTINVNGLDIISTTGALLLTLNGTYNLVTYSEQFDNAAWTKTGGSITANTTLAFDGTTSADTFTEDTATSAHSFNFSTISSLSGVSCTGSVYLSAGTRRYVIVSLSNSSNTCYAVVDTVGWTITQASSTGTGTYTSSSITLVSAGIYRVTVTGLIAAAVNLNICGSTSSTPGAAVPSYLGTSSIIIAWGAQLESGAVKAYQRVVTTGETNLPVLTIGNNYALTAPFSGSIALVKIGTIAPTTEQASFIYEQEKALHRDNVQALLPSSTGILDIAYDELSDRCTAIQPTYESTWIGLIRIAANTPSAGSFSKVAVNSAMKLLYRTTTAPGVDLSIPNYGIREEFIRKAEAASRLAKIVSPAEFDTASFTCTTVSGSNTVTAVASIVGTVSNGMGITATNFAAGTSIKNINGTTYVMSSNATGSGTTQAISQAEYPLSVGYTALEVLNNGQPVREGSTKNFIRLFDGFKETIRFAPSPGSAVWVQALVKNTTGT